jgi:TetR/AcrR family transcriptional repressor of nem operon
MQIEKPSARPRLLDAALGLIRTRGYEATTVDELCAAAGVTKGAFFHHFRSKEELGIAAADHFGAKADFMFGGMPYMQLEDPLQRLLGYIDLRIAIISGSLPQFTCLLGTMVQETYQTHERLRAACEANINAHARQVAELVEAARLTHAPEADWSSESLAYHTQAVIQGAFILAKAKNGPQVAVDSLLHLRRYIELLFASECKTSEVS